MSELTITIANAERLATLTLADVLTPPPPVDFVRWAEENIVFSDRETPFPGPYNRALFGYFDEILRALSPDDPCRVVTLKGSAQIGKTVVANTFCGGALVMDPADFLYTHPTEDNASRWSKMKLIAAVLGGRIGIDDEMSRFEGSPVVIDEQGKVSVKPFNVKDGTAIISITGSLVNRGAWLGASSGLTSYEGIQHQLKSALTDAGIKNVILDINSPGGEAIGAFETAAMVRDVAAKKPVIAVVNGMAASAAYAIASGASEIVTTESGVSGSIGVISLHVDQSRALENEGLKPTLIFAGAHKADGNPFGPLPEGVRADFQARVDGIYAQFLRTVEAGRGTRMSVDKARATEARTLIGQAAVDAGLADRVGTFESVLTDLSRGKGRSTTSSKGRSMTEANSGPAAETNAGITKADLDAAVTKATADAAAAADARIKADRDRMAAIDVLAGKVGADNKEALKIIADAKVNGTSAGDTALALIAADAFTKAAVLTAIKQDDASAAGARPASAAEGSAATPQTPEGWKAEYAKDPRLQAEFGSEASYVAFMKADAAGQVKILAGRAAA